MIDYGSNVLKINGKRLELMQLPAVVSKILLPTDDMVVVRYSVADVKEKFDAKYRNVFAVNMQGEVLWQIEPSPFEQKIPPDGHIQRYAFQNLWLTEDGKLMVDSHGIQFEVDAKTGKLSKGELAK
ncbi:MAG: hypothetical protein NT145_01085 [Elusimicrobia bacterium]|nr:hypothetical protein [Elusimicrobiota bacterium]